MQQACDNETKQFKLAVAVSYLIQFTVALTIGVIYIVWLANVNKIEFGLESICKANPDVLKDQCQD